MTQLVASTMPKSVEEGVTRARHARRKGADLVEFRIDRFRDPEQVRRLVNESRVPSMVACRVPDDGGSYDDSPENRRRLLLAAADAGAHWIDLEHWETLCLPAGTGAKVVRSYHRLAAAPRDLPRIVDRMARTGADALKVTLRAYDAADLDLVVGLYDREYPMPLAAFLAGEHGFSSRFLALVRGAPFLYCLADADGATAPGQPDLFEARELYRARQLAGSGRFWGLAGSPVSHSLGLRLHNHLSRILGDCPSYLPFDSKEPERLLRGLRQYGDRFVGLSVTAPLKRMFVPCCDEQSDDALACGAVNTLIHDGSTIRGANTDVDGVRLAVAEALEHGADLSGKSAIVVGGGGSARAAVLGLQRLGASVSLAVRSRQGIRAFSEQHDVPLLPIDAKAFDSVDPDVLVHATPVGQGDARGAAGACLVEPRSLRPGMIVLDLVYAPAATPLIHRAIAAGCIAVSGIAMFLHQAREQIRLVLGRRVPDLESLRALLGPAGREPLVWVPRD